MNAHRPIVVAVCTILLGSAAFPAIAANPAVMPRVLLRDPFGVAPAKAEEVVVTVAGAVRDAGGAAIRTRDFARLVDSRPDVRQILDGARASMKSGAEADHKGKSADAVKKLESAIDDFDSVGMEVWNPPELAAAWAHLGVARAHLAQSARKQPGTDVGDALRRAKALAPDLTLSPKEYAAKDISAFNKATTAVPPPPGPPGDGFWSLARVMGLDGLVEIRSDDHGVLSLRAHRVKPANVKTQKIVSHAPGLDATARQQLTETLGFVTPGAVAISSGNRSATFLAEGDATPVTTKPTPTPKPGARPTPAGPVLALIDTSNPDEGGDAPAVAATPKPAATAKPTASPLAAATPRSTATNKPVPAGTRVASAAGTPSASASATGSIDSGESHSDPAGPDARSSDTPGPPAGSSAGLPGGDSWLALVGGVDHRAAVYSATSGFVDAPSGEGAAAGLRMWLVGKSWALDAGANGVQRTYLVAVKIPKTSTAEEGWARVLHGDDASGMWWIGAGVAYINEPQFIVPGTAIVLVPAVTRITPGVTGQAHFMLLSWLAVRASGTAGGAVENVGAGFGHGVGLDLLGEASTAIAVTHRVRLTLGGSAHRITSEYSAKQTEIETRWNAWAGVEAGF